MDVQDCYHCTRSGDCELGKNLRTGYRAESTDMIISSTIDIPPPKKKIASVES